MKTIHIQGWSNEINSETFIHEFSDNYDLDVGFDFDGESKDVIPNIFFRFYECDEKCSLDDAIKNRLRQEFGDLTLTGQEYGYSEYTIEGFDVTSGTLGGHELYKIIQSKRINETTPKYLHILIDKINR